jgi:hypothetical protein
MAYSRLCDCPRKKRDNAPLKNPMSLQTACPVWFSVLTQLKSSAIFGPSVLPISNNIVIVSYLL